MRSETLIYAVNSRGRFIIFRNQEATMTVKYRRRPDDEKKISNWCHIVGGFTDLATSTRTLFIQMALSVNKELLICKNYNAQIRTYIYKASAVECSAQIAQ
jgi:hypothetical protein